MLMTARNRELEPMNLRLLKSEVAAVWVDVSHELADILVVLDEVLCLEIPNLFQQLKLNPEVGDNHPAITHLTASLWFRSMDHTIRSTSSATGPNNERKNVAAAEKQLESIGYRLTQESGRWSF